MTHSCRIAPQTVAAYRKAIYEIEAPGGIISLRVDSVSQALLALMRTLRAQTGVLLTAHNPRSQVYSDAENRAAQAALNIQLVQGGYRTMCGEGRSPSGDWPAETSTFVFDITLQQAEKIARQYDQNAFLWVGSDGFCALHLLRPIANFDSRSGLNRVAGLA